MIKVLYVVNNSVYYYDANTMEIALEFISNLEKCGCVGVLA